jgi:hypothetical protein
MLFSPANQISKLPPIDLTAPEVYETATFAFG